MAERNDTTYQDRKNRAKKLEGRAKRRRFVQGTRAYTHALTNSIAKRSRKGRKQSAEGAPPDGSS